MDPLFISPIKRGNTKWARRNKNKQKRIRHKRTLNLAKHKIETIKTLIINPDIRNSRSKYKEINKKRDSSIPHRGKRIICTEQIKTINEQGENGQWIHPFTGQIRNIPTTNISVDGREIQCTVDTGCTRVMMTSQMAKSFFGLDIIQKLSKYPRRITNDAQNNPVKILGYKQCQIKIGEFLKTSYPIVIYEAHHEELLLGYTFLYDYDIAVYPGRGIGLNPSPEIIKRLNYIEEPMQCFSIEEIAIPPKAIQSINCKVKVPYEWSQNDRIAIIGTPVVTHSEDLQSVEITDLQCPYTYDIISIDHTVNVTIDNMDNLEPLIIPKGELVAHAEVVHDKPSNEHINKIITESYT